MSSIESDITGTEGCDQIGHGDDDVPLHSSTNQRKIARAEELGLYVSDWQRCW